MSGRISGSNSTYSNYNNYNTPSLNSDAQSDITQALSASSSSDETQLLPQALSASGSSPQDFERAMDASLKQSGATSTQIKAANSLLPGAGEPDGKSGHARHAHGGGGGDDTSTSSYSSSTWSA